MAKYQRKHLLVEARQHEGPKIAVISNLKGNETAVAGDYLVTDPAATEPRGSVYVIPKADFEKDHELVDENNHKTAAADDKSHALLSASRNALRTYQFGNDSPDLAKEVADSIADHLGPEKVEEGPETVVQGPKPVVKGPKPVVPHD
jgi:hypothetical protein